MTKKKLFGVLSVLGILAFSGYAGIRNMFFPNPFDGQHLPKEMPAHEDIVSPLKANLKAGVNTNFLEGDWSYGMGLRYLSKESTYLNIKSQGFDHIRLPINFTFLYSDKEDTLIEDKMVKIDNILNLAERAGLYTFVDFHGWWELGENYKEDSAKFVRIWELVAERYKDRSNYIAFDLINEPKGNLLSPARLNKMQAEAIAQIRKTNPTRLILLAAPDGNQPWQLGELEVPEGDENLAVAVHIYHPGDFTHQGFTWAGREAGKQVRLGEKGMEELQWNLNETKKFIEKTGLTVFLNEFGLNFDLADPEDIDIYLRTMTSFCEENNAPWAIWNYCSGEMGVFVNGKWREDILDCLFLR